MKIQITQVFESDDFGFEKPVLKKIKEINNDIKPK